MKLVTVSTHVLDVADGRPAEGVRVTLAGRTMTTNLEGRIADLSAGGIAPGSYQIVFDLAGYFGDRPHLFDRVSLDLVLPGTRHYHVPLLVSPYSCSSYRGT